MTGTFKVAHLRVQGVDVIIIFVNNTFENLGDDEQGHVHQSLQVASQSAGLRGNVVLVWSCGSGRMRFRAPQNQHAFFRSVDYTYLYSQVNRTLTCA